MVSKDIYIKVTRSAPATKGPYDEASDVIVMDFSSCPAVSEAHQAQIVQALCDLLAGPSHE